jgi:hypothetical protein
LKGRAKFKEPLTRLISVNHSFRFREKIMADEEKRDRQGTAEGDENETGDPGRTPGTAEGDEETVDEDLRDKELDAQ